MTEEWEEYPIELSPHRQATVRSMIEAWSAHIARFIAEMDVDIDVAYDWWGVDDFIAALCLRDFISGARAALSPADLPDFDAAILPADEEFMRITVADPDRSMARIGGFETREGWWWGRVPREGPIAAELASWSWPRELSGE
ncbi:hypothetical protein [Arthrobacter bambusae]|uniref:hypothetical protein n=1 Tax=Arthrobacter bambusae TaxID=1338426 RepID=UPI0027D89618|nr:hypothetical protein [Arthrobacter bambusae]